ncbi:hypothetical protein [Sandaracinobacteroides saxicola]|uniref:Uncharacterized protein n=1 Tax=Sandaracinobacteroides saxicola TaxID=2759707 RepID=A0A7G5IEB7_9SPHN|nr:hypothetical protein [Sandaracinobacteroides saxicola]QMW21709.1 hypothetical protein H3309_09800 [Sandaracinobacteroides saxicola]
MPLKEFLETDPLVLVSGVAVAAGGLVAGVMAWFGNQASDRKVAMERQAGADAAAALQREVAAAKQESAGLKAELAERDRRFASIERRIGDEQALIDVRKFFIAANGALALGDGYRSLEGGRFYIRDPAVAGIVYQAMSEADLQREGWFVEGVTMPIDAAAEQLTVHVWRRDAVRTRLLAVAAGEDELDMTVNSWPQVILQYVRTDTIRDIQRRNMLATQEKDDAGTPHELGPDQIKLLEKLGGDPPTAGLINMILGAVQMQSVSPHLSVSFDSVQRSAGILYLSYRLLFNIPDSPPLTVLQETYVVPLAHGIVFVRMQIPTEDGLAASDRAWTNDWLSGLRIVTDPA